MSCFSPQCFPCGDLCFPPFSFPCWPCAPCPCPPPEKLAIPYCFPDCPKRPKKKKKRRRKPPSKAVEADEPEPEPYVNPCKCCKCCVCMGLKTDQDWCEGAGQCCTMCRCRGCQPCSPPCYPCCPPPPACPPPPPCPAPKPCSCSPPPPACPPPPPPSCTYCDPSCKASQMQPEVVRCERCGHRKKAAQEPPKYDYSIPQQNFVDATLTGPGQRKGPVCYACCKSTDAMRPSAPVKNTVKTCNECGKQSQAKSLCAGCQFLGTI